MLALLLVWSLLAPANHVDVVVATVQRGDVSLPLAPAGRVDFRRDVTVTRVKVEIERVPPAYTMGSALNVYVAWAVSPEGVIENLGEVPLDRDKGRLDRKSTRLNSSHLGISYAVFCLKKKNRDRLDPRHMGAEQRRRMEDDVDRARAARSNDRASGVEPTARPADDTGEPVSRRHRHQA